MVDGQGKNVIVSSDGTITLVDPTPEEIAAKELMAEQVLAQRQAREALKTREQTFVADTDRQELLNQLLTATPAQIKNYVNNNVTDLASAKILLSKIILLLAIAIKT